MLVMIAACKADADREPASINELAEQLSPQLEGRWNEAAAEMREHASKCGTSVVVFDAKEGDMSEFPKDINGRFHAAWIASSATPQQVSCVRQLYPDTPVAPK